MDSEKDFDFCFFNFNSIWGDPPQWLCTNHKKGFCTRPSPSAMKEVLKALHIFILWWKASHSILRLKSLSFVFRSNFHVYCETDTFLPSNIPFCLCRIFFLNDGLTFSSTLSLSSIHSKEWESTITSHVRPRLLLPIVKPVVLGVVSDDWDSDQENFHYFIRSNR